MTTTSPVPTHRFPQLDSVRAMAALMVVTTHVAFWSGVYGRGTIGVMAQRLEVGVAIFFVLSGFLLSRPFLLHARYGTATDSTAMYALKRAGRILPVYLLLVVLAFVALRDNRELGGDRLALNLSLLDFFVHPQLPAGLTQMWSLSVEASFYVILPLVGTFVLARSWRPNTLIVGLVTVGLAGLVYLGMTTRGGGLEVRWLPSYALWFTLGIVLAVVQIDGGSTRLVRRLRRWARDRTACWLLALGLFAIISTPLGGAPSLAALTPDEAVLRHLFYAAVAVLFVAPCVFVTNDAPARLLSQRWFRHLGATSYALFCCHMLILELVVRSTSFALFRSPFLPLYAIILGTSLVAAEALYRFVEKPVIDAVHRRAKAARATAPRATAANT